ncbi:MAG: radical SAM protein [Deltaproteobacteria bacterium]|nr:MAG: radical SAM protein [Deltaproteobacteria bacterium]
MDRPTPLRSPDAALPPRPPDDPMTPLNTRNRRLVLVEFFWTRDKDPRIPLGHASLLTAVRERGRVEVRSLPIAVNSDEGEASAVTTRILRETAGLPHHTVDIAFGAYVWGETLLRDVLRRLRDAGFAGRVILGGPQISYHGGGLESLYPEADVFIRGYGEEALATLVESAQSRSIPGVHHAGEVDLVLQAAVELESLPSPWLTGTIPLGNQAFIRWETQRGCPFRCAFCQHREPGAQFRRRLLGLPRILKEVDLFCESGVRDIAVLDPIFNLAPHATEVLERFVERGYTGRLSLQCRAEGTRDDFLDAAARLNTRLEYGLQTIHRAEMVAIRRPNNMPQVDDTLARVRARGLQHEVSLIFGLPHQTLASFEQSIAWCLERQVPVLKAFPLMLLRGTALERDRDRWNIVAGGGPMAYAIASDSFTPEDWAAMARLSEALRVTEGRHPHTIEELRSLARTLEPDLLRFVPHRDVRAA